MSIEDSYPLSPVQHGMIVHSLAAPDSGVYIQQLICSVHEDLNVPAFRRAWQAIVKRHAVFRTRFNWQVAGEPLQEVYSDVHLPFMHQDWTALPGIRQEEQLQDFLRADRRKGFKLDEAPLLRLAVFRCGRADYRWVWTSHHGVLDGRSRLLVLKEFFALYEQFCRGGILDLESPPPYREYIDWLLRQDLTAGETFWRRALSGFTAATPLVVERASVQPEGEYFGEQRLRLSERSTRNLLSLAELYQLTPNTFLQGAWALLLSRYSGREDVVFGATRAGRHSTAPGAQSTAGLFINTLPVRVRISPKKSLIPWLNEVRSQWIAMREFEHIPLIQIQQWSEIPPGHPLFETLVTFENYELDSALEKENKKHIKQEFRLIGATNYPLSVAGYLGRELLLNVTYDRRRFEDAAITRMLGHLRSLLEGMVSSSTSQLSDLPLLTAKERHQLLIEWNDTRKSYPKDQCIQQLFEQQVERTPENVAAVFGEQKLTYRELNQRANQMARYLRKHGVGPEVLVGVCVERSLEMVIAPLAILKAGGAYVPVDAAYPSERLDYMLEDTQAPVLLTQKKLLAGLPELSRSIPNRMVVCLDDWSFLDREEPDNPVSPVTANNLAYVMYTSGSTGKPKGVSVSHRGVTRLVKGTDYAQLTDREVFLQFAPLSFDASTFEIWAALLNGARLEILAAHTPSLKELAEAIERRGITTLWLTSALFQLLAEDHVQNLSGVKQLLAGGDVLSAAHAKQVLSELPGCRLINGYGPTENTTFTCCYQMTSIEQAGDSVPIGRPIANTEVYLLDDHLRPVPIGISGELYIGGDGLARGYFNNPELTAEKFIPHPFGTEPGQRLYKTGDLARYLPDGNIEFLGRVDNQVKLRGFRIELAEIEAQLAEHPSVAMVAVAVREETGEKRIVAYTVPAANRIVDAAELRSFLQQKLPEFMLPAQFVVLYRLPLTPNGKVDRRALPAPDQSRPELKKSYAAPRTQVEETLAAIWAEVLRLERVGIYDNFFESGGHSLKVTQVISRVCDTFEVELPPGSLFDAPTVAGFAGRVVAALWITQGPQASAYAMTDDREEIEL
ncbi:MAG: non-ribosomal peptide synthetase [Candidatus Binatia bacterium]